MWTPEAVDKKLALNGSVSITILHATKSNDGSPREIVPPGTSRNDGRSIKNGVILDGATKNHEVLDQKVTAEIDDDGRKGDLMDPNLTISVGRLFRGW